MQAHKAGRAAGRSARAKHKLAKGVCLDAWRLSNCFAGGLWRRTFSDLSTDSVAERVEGGVRASVKSGPKAAAGKAQRVQQAKLNRCALWQRHSVLKALGQAIPVLWVLLHLLCVLWALQQPCSVLWMSSRRPALCCTVRSFD